MNEHGLAIVIFTASGTEVETGGKKIPLSNHSLYRAIIDRCKTVSEDHREMYHIQQRAEPISFGAEM